MMRAQILTRICVAGLLSGGLVSTGCGRTDEPETNVRFQGEEPRPADPANPAAMPEHGQDLTVTGCLTASIDGRSYALTPSDSPATRTSQGMAVPGSSTITYELVGNAEDFRRHANTMVTARGRSDASARREADMERRDEAEQQPASGSKDTPVVETKEEVDVNVRRLHVARVVGTGEACPSIGGGEGKATGAPEAAGAAGAKGTPPRPKERP